MNVDAQVGPLCMRCGAEITGTPVPALRKGFTVAVLVTVTDGLSFDTHEDETLFYNRVETTEALKDTMVADGWTRGYVAEECIGG